MWLFSKGKEKEEVEEVVTLSSKVKKLMSDKDKLDQELANVTDMLDKVKLDKAREVERLNKRIIELDAKTVKLELQHKISEEDIEHLIKMKEERDSIEFERKELNMEKEHREALHLVKDEYQLKTEKSLEKQRIEMKEMYEEVLKRLPNINARLNVKA